RRIKQAAITHRMAQHDAYTAGVKEQEQLEKARNAPGEIVQTVGEQLKAGEIGYRGVERAAAKITRTTPRRRRLSQASEQIRFVRNLIQRLDQIFDEGRDERVRDLQQLLLLQRDDQLFPEQRQRLIDALRAVKDRITKYEQFLLLLNLNDSKIDEWAKRG